MKRYFDFHHLVIYYKPKGARHCLFKEVPDESHTSLEHAKITDTAVPPFSGIIIIILNNNYNVTIILLVLVCPCAALTEGLVSLYIVCMCVNCLNIYYINLIVSFFVFVIPSTC